jgi:hypothetical protein
MLPWIGSFAGSNTACIANLLLEHLPMHRAGVSWENGDIESFNGKVREQFLTGSCFMRSRKPKF